jgi:co-chaperonin GroES (HSP10)
VNGCIIAKAAVTYEGRGGTNADSALTFDNWGTVLESCVEVEAQAAAPVYSDCSNSICENFAVHGGTTITFADGVSAKTTIGGDIGVSPGTSITGLQYVTFTEGERLSTPDSADFASRVNEKHSSATSTKGKKFTELSGGVFTPGTYTASSTISFAGAGTFATLDGENDENAVFLFQAGTAMTTAANTYFKLINGAKAENVLFALGSAATLGAGCVLQGSLIVGTSVTMGLDAQVNGCIIAKAAVTYEGRGGTAADSSMTFNDAGTVLEHCVEVDAPTSSPTRSDHCGNSVCEDYAIHAGTTITFANGGALTTVGGDIGVAPGTSITGMEYMMFEYGSRISTANAGDYASRVDEKHSSKGTTIAEMSMQTYTPGIYTSGSSINFAGAGTYCTLDAEGDENAVFVFQAGTTLTTAANTYFKLINGAKADNVLFALGSAATLGASSVLEGSLIVGTSVTVGSDAQINGCIIAKAAVTFESRGGVVGVGSLSFNDSGNGLEYCIDEEAPTASPTAGDSDCFDTSTTVCEDYALHAGTTITFANGGALTTVGGDIAVNPGTSITGMEYMTFMYGERISTAAAADFASRVNEKHSSALATKGTTIAEMSMQTYTPGIYTSGSSINFAGAGTYCTLDAKGDNDAVFVFQAGTTLTTAANTYFKLINGARAENVIFALGSAATLGASSVLEGSLIVGTSVTVGSDAQVNGCIIAKAAITFESRGGVLAASALTFNDSGTGLEHCVEVGDEITAQQASPTLSPTISPASTPTSSRGDPHCKYQRFRFIVLACR